jgi:hydrogenase maturation protease
MSRMLIAGVGNIFLGDDGFGVEVARRLATADLPDFVRVADYGISGLHLAYDLAEGYESTILIDATPRGGEPGTIYTIELRHSERPPDSSLAGSQLFDAHGMQPDVVFGVLDMLGADAGRVLVVGCEPASVDYGIGLSAPVTAAVSAAVRIVTDLVAAAAAGTGTDAAREQGPQVTAGQPTTAGQQHSAGQLAASQQYSADQPTATDRR